MNRTELTSQIRLKALELGISSIGFSKSEFLESEAKKYDAWLNNNYQGKMDYMSRNVDKRLDPGLLVENAKSVISVLHNYYPEQNLFDKNSLKVSRYAYGEDYHYVLKDKLYELLNFIKEKVGDVSARVFTDSAPVLERAWAMRSGLGWIGKNANLISKQAGSYFFLGEIIIDVEFDYNSAVTDHCGSCTKCIDACPTDAILKPQVVDGSKCISYLTIELKENLIPREFQRKLNNWIFGCDICQEVCPWNRFAKPTLEPRFKPILSAQLINSISNSMTDLDFKTIFHSSPILRTGKSGLLRNIDSSLNIKV
ncbi:MAG: tRNA epoxyqueuosine(34) reductase QueG [Crocinitomicaceae bacterium]|nr:tRNA epoxyqueuosine(34) reductase QueG [Crocinitomicaceae bacterium]